MRSYQNKDRKSQSKKSRITPEQSERMNAFKINNKMNKFATTRFQKAQISKLERNAKNVAIETILKVFWALKANIKFSVEMKDGDFNAA